MDLPVAGSLPESIAGFPVVRRLGEGGMGVVYMARDPRLERMLAVKVLAPRRWHDPQALDRLRREARVLASLNHPNIATIYDVADSADGSTALILEYLDGTSLEERIRQGPLGIEESLKVGGQIAEALDEAHRRGVIHRDLKPGNVMLLRDDRVKLLDFGIALAPSAPAPPKDDTTVDAGDIDLGAGVAGTPGYISPEVLRFETVDARADVFALGCVMYECLTGQRAFKGSTPSALIMSTLADEVDRSRLPQETPKGLHELLDRCLKKDPAIRLPDAGTARREIARMLKDPAGPDRRAEPSNLPPVLTRFFGRQDEIGAADQLLGQARLVTLTGSGGCGKTRLAMRIAETREAERFGEPRFVELAALTEAGRVPGVLAALLEVREEAGTSILEAIAKALASSRTFLILDNCEHLRDAVAALVASLLQACPGLTILATSRERLGVAGEQEFRVDPLPVPRDGDMAEPERLLSNDAVCLFVDRARLVRPGWEPAPGQIQEIADIVRRLDGIPLAIELAAARIRVLSTAQIRDRLRDRFRLLATEERGGPERHRTLRATLDWSHDLLSDRERQLFHSLSVFAGFTLDMAIRISGARYDEFEVLDVLTHLIDKSMVVVDDAPGREPRYRMLETLRQYANEKLAESVEFAPVRDRHLEACLEFARKARPQFQGPDQPEWLARVEREHDNLLAAMEWAIADPERIDQALEMGASLWPFWEARCHYALGRSRIEQTLAADRRTVASAFSARALGGAGTLAWGQGDYRAARRYHERALDIYRALGDRRGIAISLGSMGLIAMEEDDLPAALAHFKEALPTFETLGDRIAVARTLGNLALVHRGLGDAAASLDLQERSLAIHRELSNVRSVALALYNLAGLYIARADRGRAAVTLREALDIYRQLGDRKGIALCFERVSEMIGPSGAVDVAAQLLGAAAQIREEIRIPTTPLARAELGKLEFALRAALGADGYVRARASGARLAEPAAFDIAVKECAVRG